MLEIIVNILGCLIMSITEFFVIKKIIKSKEKIISPKNAFIIIALAIATSVLYSAKYTGVYTILTFVLSIIAYKFIFKQNFIESIITVAMFMIYSFFTDMLTAMGYMCFMDVETLRGSIYVRLSANIVFGLISIGLINIKIIKNTLNKIYEKIKGIRYNSTILFLTLTIIAFTVLEYNFYSKYGWNADYGINILAVVIFYILLTVFFIEKNHTSKLTAEYDSLFTYIQNFEDWIEKEQLNRHEYKNQLAVLRMLSKDKKVKSKIDEILEDNINLEGEVVHQLKELPKGGIKGLMYYKLVIAQKNKIDLTVDVSLKSKSILNKLSEKQIRDLCKLIGIYFDNAIEAAKETKKKNVLIEIYELKDKVNFVFSNTFKKSKNFSDRNQKGISSKGEGRGNGLYFASKIISKNDWLEEKQEIIDGYYIEQLSILKN